MKQRIKSLVVSLGAIAAVLFPALSPVAVSAVDPGFGACSGNSNSQVCKARNTDNVFSILKSVINILLTVVGIVAVILIIVGGLRYITSAGDQSQITGAKNTILYAVIGLIIAAMAFAIVNYVITNI